MAHVRSLYPEEGVYNPAEQAADPTAAYRPPGMPPFMPPLVIASDLAEIGHNGLQHIVRPHHVPHVLPPRVVAPISHWQRIAMMGLPIPPPFSGMLSTIPSQGHADDVHLDGGAGEPEPAPEGHAAPVSHEGYLS